MLPFTLRALLPEFAGDLPDIAVGFPRADSRLVQRGDVFFALPGAKVHGATFAEQVIMQGAAAIVADHTAQSFLPQSLDVPVIEVDDVRHFYAQAASHAFSPQPPVIAAVTGTNGKTSVCVFLRQIWQHLGHVSASVGTIGIVAEGYTKNLGLTTPDAGVLHQSLQELAERGISHVAMEASSHGLEQRRLDGVQLSAVGFTNFTRDHLDYHGTMDAYRAAKLRLFDTLAPQGIPAVIAVDSPDSAAFVEAAETARLSVWTVGEKGQQLRLLDARPDGFGSRLSLEYQGMRHDLLLPLAGTFQVENVLVAAGMALALGGETEGVFAALEHLQGAAGRLEKVGAYRGGFVVVDYAHTPDALEEALKALRPYVRGRLIVVFGCGGDRDAGKRPLMGAVAARLADVIIVTDDNPRSEEPRAIRAAILAAAPAAQEIGDRRAAIEAGIEMLRAGDVLLIAGKGHERGQIVGATVHPFSDHDVVRETLALQGAA